MDIKFSQDALAKLNSLLMDMPYRYAAPIIGLVNHQIQVSQEAYAAQVGVGTPPPGE